MKILTYGTFDLFHIGHLNILRRAKALGGHLTVAISTDEFNLESKNKVCAQPYYERAEIVHAIKYVDEVIAETSWDQKVKDVVAQIQQLQKDNKEVTTEEIDALLEMAHKEITMQNLCIQFFTAQRITQQFHCTGRIINPSHLKLALGKIQDFMPLPASRND